MKLDDVFTGIGMRRGKVQGKTMINGPAVYIAKLCERRAPRRQLGLDQPAEQRAQIWAGETDNRNAAPARRRCDGRYDVICHAPAWRSPSTG